MRHLSCLLACATFFIFCSQTIALPGDLDTGGIGGGFGRFSTDVTGNADLAYAVKVQPDGKIVVAGTCGDAGDFKSMFCVARYQETGELDTNFGDGGTVLTVIGSYAAVFDVEFDSDERIVVVGACYFEGDRYYFCAARYKSNGAPDASFNGSGYVVTSVTSATDFAHSVRIQPDGKLVLGGSCFTGESNADFCAIRYHTDGTLDTSFAVSGALVTDMGPHYDYVHAMALQPDGKIVLAGYCSTGSGIEFCAARYKENGSLDSSFGIGGRVLTNMGTAYAFINDISLQADGKIVAVGSCRNGSVGDFCMARYLPNGNLDTSFDVDGRVITPVGTLNDLGAALQIQSDGYIVVAGSCFDGSGHDFCLTRYKPSGSLDLYFGSGGKVFTSIGKDDRAYALALQPDGKIVAAGACFNGSNDDFCLARYLGGH